MLMLEQLYDLREEIRETRSRMRRLSARYGGIQGVRYDGIKTCKTYDVKSPAERGAVMAIEAEEALADLLRRQEQAQAYIVRWISCVDDISVRRALMLRFFDGMSWPDVTLALGARVEWQSVRDRVTRWCSAWSAEHPDFEPPEYLKPTDMSEIG